MTEYGCDVCGQKFKSSQALGSHLKYKHGGRKIRDDEGLDLKGEFLKLLGDLGIRKAKQTLADIFFDLGADSLSNLEYVLRLAGVTNPSKTLVLTRWGQRIGQQPSEDLIKVKDERGEGLFGAYDQLLESEMKELLIADMRERIESKRGARAKRADEGGGLEAKFDELIMELKLGGMRGRGQTPTWSNELWWCQDPYHGQPCGVCFYCGGHIHLGYFPWGGSVICPRCGTQYTRTF